MATQVKVNGNSETTSANTSCEVDSESWKVARCASVQVGSPNVGLSMKHERPILKPKRLLTYGIAQRVDERKADRTLDGRFVNACGDPRELNDGRSIEGQRHEHHPESNVRPICSEKSNTYAKYRAAVFRVATAMALVTTMRGSGHKTCKKRSCF